MDPSSQSIGRTGLCCRGTENPEDWPVLNTRVVASLFTSWPGPGVAWWSTEMLNLQTPACRCFWNLSSSTSSGQTATVHFQRPEGGSVRTTFCLTVGTHVRPEISATHPQLLLGKTLSWQAILCDLAMITHLPSPSHAFFESCDQEFSPRSTFWVLLAFCSSSFIFKCIKSMLEKSKSLSGAPF